MKRQASWLACVVAVGCLAVTLGARVGQSSSSPRVVISGPEGKTASVAFVPNSTRIENVLNTSPRVTGPPLRLTTGRTDVRLSDGQIISAFAFDGWIEDTDVHIVVTALVPADGSNRYVETAFGQQPPPMRKRAFTEFTVAIGQSRSIDEMKALGIAPMVVRVDTQTPDSPRRTSP